jgi:integrase
LACRPTLIAGEPNAYKYNDRRRRKIPKARYRLTNWPEYDAAVVRRGSITGTVGTQRRHPDAVRQILTRRAAAAGVKGTLLGPITPHGMRAGFITTAYRNGVPDEEIMSHTRHRSLTIMRSYVRRAKPGTASPPGKLDL